MLLPTSVLLTRYIEEDRSDKAASLSNFVDTANNMKGEDLGPPDVPQLETIDFKDHWVYLLPAVYDQA